MSPSTNEKACVGGTTPAAGHHQTSSLKYNGTLAPAQRNSVDETRLRYLARRLHALGERPVYEYLREIVAGANAVDRLEAFARLDPAIVAALGGETLPSILATLDGGARG